MARLDQPAHHRRSHQPGSHDPHPHDRLPSGAPAPPDRRTIAKASMTAAVPARATPPCAPTSKPQRRGLSGLRTVTVGIPLRPLWPARPGGGRPAAAFVLALWLLSPRGDVDRVANTTQPRLPARRRPNRAGRPPTAPEPRPAGKSADLRPPAAGVPPHRAAAPAAPVPVDRAGRGRPPRAAALSSVARPTRGRAPPGLRGGGSWRPPRCGAVTAPAPPGRAGK